MNSFVFLFEMQYKKKSYTFWKYFEYWTYWARQELAVAPLLVRYEPQDTADNFFTIFILQFYIYSHLN